MVELTSPIKPAPIILSRGMTDSMLEAKVGRWLVGQQANTLLNIITYRQTQRR